MTAARHSYSEQFVGRGVAIIEHALSESDLERMSAAFVDAGERGGTRQVAVRRDLVDWLAIHPALGGLAAELAGASTRLVRLIAFDKTPAANWFVPWHQDRSIAVQQRVERPGYDRWTVKDGLIQVEPPVTILEGMVTLRVHLDACGEDAGPLEVLPQTHARGRLDRDEIARLAGKQSPLLCLAALGDVVAMRPLLVHRSQKARVPNHRRVLHLEYATAPLPAGLNWAMTASEPVN